MLTGVHVLESLIKSGTVRNGMVLSAERNYPGSETAEKEIDSIMHEQFAFLLLVMLLLVSLRRFSRRKKHYTW